MVWDAVWEQEGAARGAGGREGSPRAEEDQGGWTQIPPAATCLASHPEGLLYPLGVVGITSDASSQATDILILVPQVLPGMSLKLVLLHVLKTRECP